MDSQPILTKRNIWQYAYLFAVILLIFLLPLAAHYLLAPTAAGWTILISLAFLAFLGGMFDAFSFRFTWSFPLLFGVAFWVSAALYYPPGSWIYGIIVILVAAAGGKIFDRPSVVE